MGKQKKETLGWGELLILGAVPFVMVLGNSMLIPVFPKFEQVLNINQVKVGLLVTAFSLPAGLLIPFSGILSDRIGRKIVIAPALVLYGLGGLVAGIASITLKEPFTVILAGRVLQGLGAGGTYQLAMALTADLITEAKLTRYLGFLEASNGLGKVVSPVLGSLVAMITWYAPFFVYGILAFPIAALVWFGLHEPNPGGEGESWKQYFSTLGQIIKKKGVSLFVAFLIGFLALSILFGFLSYLSDILEQRFHLQGVVKGLALAVPVGAMAATSYGTGVFLEKRQHLLKWALIVGMAIAALSLAVVPICVSKKMVFPAAVIAAGIGIGMVLPPLNTFITGATSQDERGVVTAVYGTVRFFGVAVGPPAFGAIGFDRVGLFYGVGALALAAALLGYFLIDPQRLLAYETSP
ncbi:MAG: MFS transporter [Firmicutes bacterium]|nr:MFS transporter [Bacillota bacterium]